MAALIVETGEGLSNADAYCDADFVRAYCESRGMVIPEAILDQRLDVLIRIATDYLSLYGSRLKGSRAVDAQALDWPRVDVATRYMDVVPLAVQQACATLAHKAISGPLLRDVKPAKKRVKVGPLETENFEGAATQTTYPEVDRLLAPFLETVNPYCQPLARG